MALTRKQKLAVDALATTTTNTEAAEKAGCARRSIQGWLKETEFRNALLEREMEALEKRVGALEAANEELEKRIAALEAKMETGQHDD